MMDWGITFPEELQRMKDNMDQTWNELFKEQGRKEEEVEKRLRAFRNIRGKKSALHHFVIERNSKGV